jgi:hypothetical protein
MFFGRIRWERHLRHLLQSYASYYNQARTHLSLNKDSPVSRPDLVSDRDTAAKSWWEREGEAFPDLDEITAFSVLIKDEPPAAHDSGDT